MPMPMTPRTRRLSTAAAVLALAFLFPAGGFAQQTPPPVPGGPGGAREPHSPPAQELVTIEFGGGALSGYVDLLREKFDVNAVLGSEARDLPMPPLSLKRVSLDTAMNLIGAMSRSLGGEGGAVEVKTIGDPEGSSVYMIDLVNAAQGVHTAFGGMAGQTPPGMIIPPRRMRGATPSQVTSASAPRSVQVFSIKLLTQPVSGRNDLAIQPENVLTAIDTALGLSTEKDPAQVKYHPETGLIFVHGTPEQVEAVSTLIKTLSGDLIEIQRTTPTEDLKKLVDKLREDNQRLRQEVLALRAEIETLKEGQDPRTIPSRPSRPLPLGGVDPSKN